MTFSPRHGGGGRPARPSPVSRDDQCAHAFAYACPPGRPKDCRLPRTAEAADARIFRGYARRQVVTLDRAPRLSPRAMTVLTGDGHGSLRRRGRATRFTLRVTSSEARFVNVMKSPTGGPVTADTAHRQRLRRWNWLVAFGAAALVGGLVGGVIVHWGSDSGSTSHDAVCVSTTVAKNVLPTIVTITANAGANSGSGSGEFIRPDGYVLTNGPVIAAAAHGGTTEIVLTDGESAQASIIGRDPATDLAVLKASGLRSPSVISFGSSDALNIGQPVVALGSPLGFSSSVT